MQYPNENKFLAQMHEVDTCLAHAREINEMFKKFNTESMRALAVKSTILALETAGSEIETLIAQFTEAEK